MGKEDLNIMMANKRCFQKVNSLLAIATAAIRPRLIIVAGFQRDLFIVKVVIWCFKVSIILLEDYQKGFKLVEQECLLWFQKDWKFLAVFTNFEHLFRNFHQRDSLVGLGSKVEKLIQQAAVARNQRETCQSEIVI